MGRKPDPSDEQQQLRQLTRELHEAAQDAREAARELRATRREAMASIEEYFMKQLTEWDLAIGENFAKVEERVIAKLDQVIEHQAQLLGFRDSEEMIGRIIDDLHRNLVPVLTEELERSVSEELPNCLADVFKKKARQPGRRRPQVMVGTKDMLGTIAGKADLIIDLTQDHD
jgi:cell fate (sporulation/competence/biofilm development) regulator YlbF (YheA/YmcA/DUF963 family)